MLGNMQVKIILLFVLLAITQCFSGGNIDSLNGEINSFIKMKSFQLEKENDYLNFIGIGGSIKDDYIRYKTLEFNVRKTISKEDAIKLLHEIANYYVVSLCSEKFMGKYLKKYKFNIFNLELALYIYDENGILVKHPDISIFELRNGNISYMTTEISDKNITIEKTHGKEKF